MIRIVKDAVPKITKKISFTEVLTFLVINRVLTRMKLI